MPLQNPLMFVSSFNGTAAGVSFPLVIAQGWWAVAHLGETNVLGLLTEALTAKVELVLADQTSLVLADTAKEYHVSLRSYPNVSCHCPGLIQIVLAECGKRCFVPAAGALAVGARARVPDALVRHGDGVLSVVERGGE